ncbi:S8 family serine peptidase [Streptomyces sp. NPDC002809]|uniref:S8 family serine peptidase n=1 Tax=Streptomyces sp. NPDC002809 TaxID=3154433 RepID=UPI00331AEC0E
MLIHQDKDRSRSRPRRRTLAAVGVAALATGLLTPMTSQAAGATAASADGKVVAVPGTGAVGGRWTVTLITGDTVRLTEDAAGRYTVTPDLTPRPDGRIPFFRSRSGPDGVFVIPDDAQQAVDAGILDRRLFDVKYLARNDFADGRAAQLPVIVQYRAGMAQPSVAATAQALPASTEKRSLPSIHGAAVSVDKNKAEDFWTTLRGKIGATSGIAPKALAGGVEKVWLDAKVTASLSESVPLIGAPEAWKGGWDGEGVTVAVLDSGIDATHPDLAGKIATSRSFVAGQTVADGHGHGTHVADTIVGSGAASNGSRKGVAPGARLAVGKVLDNAGSGAESDIIAGMEWATGEAGAKVVSMSLGGDPTDGTDPLSQAVNDLSASTGALFVIAAGNAGPGRTTIGTPGAAAAALTVAATDKSDKLASFSSRGPRTDGALKPDIAAPGVNITAARAAGTSLGTPVDPHYTTLNGTSMATPHVAGAAAILAEEHPDWSGARLKSALMSTAKDDGYTAYEQGAGRVDVARATAQKVTATTAGADFGAIPADDDAAADRKVTYANGGDQDVTLGLASTFGGADGAVDGVLTLSAQTVTVPAGGTADVTVTVQPGGLAQGSYSGSVVATDPSGDRVTTPVGLQRAPKTVPLTIHVLDRHGQPAVAHQFSAWAAAVDIPGVYGAPPGTVPANGTYQTRVEPGTYDVGGLATLDADDGGPSTLSLLEEPQVTVGDAGAEVTLDARKAVRLRPETPRPIDMSHARGAVTFARRTTDGTMLAGATMGVMNNVYVTPTQRVTVGRLLFSTRVTAANPQLSASVTAPSKYPLHPLQFEYFDKGRSLPNGADTPFPAGTQKRRLAYVGLASPEEIAKVDLKGKIAVEIMTVDPAAGSYWGCGIYNDRIRQLKDAGAVGVVLFADTAPGGCPITVWPTEPDPPALPVAQVLHSEGNALRKLLADGPVTLSVTSNPQIDYTYQLQSYEDGRVPPSLTKRYTGSQLATVRARYHSAATPAGAMGAEDWQSFKPRENVSFGAAFSFAAPSERTEYLGGFAADTLRIAEVDTGDGTWQTTSSIVDRPSRSTQEWSPAPATPGVQRAPSITGVQWRTQCVMCRQGDTFVPAYVSAVGSGEQVSEGGYYNANARLFRNGTEMARTPSPFPGVPVFTLPKEEAAYRLEQSGAGNADVWTFRSRGHGKDTAPLPYTCLAQLGATSPCNPLPLVFVGYDLAGTQALDNTVPAGHRHTFEIDVSHAPSTDALPAIAGLKLSYSTDDGATWKSATVRKVRQGVYSTSLTYPKLAATKGAVSLRAEAWDTSGNKVEQTTTRAFPLR